MGCPGKQGTASATSYAAGFGTRNAAGINRIGDVPILNGYNLPHVVTQGATATGGFSQSNFTMSDYYDIAVNEYNPTDIDNDSTASCSCCCSGIMPGHDIPFFSQTIISGSADDVDTWPDVTAWPGGTTGIYMHSSSSVLFYFNIGQSQRCGQIFAGMYMLHWWNCIQWDFGSVIGILNSCHYFNNLSFTFMYALGNLSPGGGVWTSPFPIAPYYTTDGPAGFDYIALCIPCYSIANTVNHEHEEKCLLTDCLNPMDYGTGIGPSAPIPGPGHQLSQTANDGSPCDPTSTVDQTCDDDPCVPNGNCSGPPSSPVPVGCINKQSILRAPHASTTETWTQNNGCFDCMGQLIAHPCYSAGPMIAAPTNEAGGEDPTPNNGLAGDWWSPDGYKTTFSTSVGISNSYKYGCANTWVSDSSNNGHWQYRNFTDKQDFYKTAKQTDQWDQCCLYGQYGCKDSTFANFNGAADLDCAGHPDPNTFKYYDLVPSSITYGMYLCENVPFLSNPYVWIDNAGFSVTSVQPSAGNPIPCDDPSLTHTHSQFGVSVNGMYSHPLSWGKTNSYSAERCCCSDAGCTDNGQGATPAGPFTSTPPNAGIENRYPPLAPPYLGVDERFYPGYDLTIAGNVTITQGPESASNLCLGCSEDCNGDAIGTFNAGWASCCNYQIGGCTETSNVNGGNHPDIYGNGAYDVWNYNPLATVDDGSCFYQQPIMGCVDDGGLGLSNVLIGGYSNPLQWGIPATNFNPDANIDDGTCIFMYACPDPYSTNYDPCADPAQVTNIATNTPPVAFPTCDPGIYNPALVGMGLNTPIIGDNTLCDYDVPGAGPGCMDPQATNFNPLATEDCGGPYFSIGVPLPIPHPGNFTCCVYPIEGCTDPNAWNYNYSAIIDDGSCEYTITTYQEGVNFLNGTKVVLCKDPLTKEEVLMNVCEPPEIQSEIFIERGKQTVFGPNQRLGEIDTMGGLTNYGYGYYNIKKQE